MNGKTYLITGASSGVGRALAIEISKRGGQVVLVARNEEKLNETLEQMEYKEKHICRMELVPSFCFGLKI